MGENTSEGREESIEGGMRKEERIGKGRDGGRFMGDSGERRKFKYSVSLIFVTIVIIS